MGCVACMHDAEGEGLQLGITEINTLFNRNKYKLQKSNEIPFTILVTSRNNEPKQHIYLDILWNETYKLPQRKISHNQ